MNMTKPDKTNKDHLPATEPPVWFITGCSTGFGRELARQAIERGYRTVVEPSGLRTDWAGRSANESPLHISDYGDTAGAGRPAHASPSH
jgi:NAD(P)-dependent dehydrogenase (short-subunit alcohol dehydrogenase family)